MSARSWRITGRGFVLAMSMVAAAAYAYSARSKTLAARWVEPVTGMEFALLPAGDFIAGSPGTEPGHRDDEVMYPVRIARAFYMATHEVTRAEWEAVMHPGSTIDDAQARLPMVNVTWHEARQFLDRLNEGRPWRMRLPSEIEWEYACRAGTTTPYSTGPDLSTAQANYNGERPLPGRRPGVNRAAPTAVGTFAPNPWGLFDMHGNVWEWTNDAYDEERKVIRGGSWRVDAMSARCALRATHRPQEPDDSVGLRLVRDLTPDESRLALPPRPPSG